MSERTVADDTLTPGASTTCWEPTGWAELMYSATTALRIAALRGSSVPGGGGRCSLVPRLSSVVVIVSIGPPRPVRPQPVAVAVGGVLALHSSEC